MIISGCQNLHRVTYPIHKSAHSPTEQGQGEHWARKKNRNKRLTESKKCSKTSVASLECKPCKSKIHSVRSSAVNLLSPTSFRAIPKMTPNPEPHDFPRQVRSPGSSDQPRSLCLAACSARRERSRTRLEAALAISTAILALRSCPSRLKRLAAAPSPLLQASAARDRQAFLAAPSCKARWR